MNKVFCDAVEQRRLVRLNYGGGSRLVEIHVYGKDREGEELIRAFQVSGHSNSSVPTGWKLFHVDEITEPILTEETFDKSRSDYKANDPVIETIYCSL